MRFRLTQGFSKQPSVARMLLLAAVLFCCVTGAGSLTAQTTDDHGNSFSDATDLALGSSVAGRIDPGDDRDVFKLDLSGASGTTDVWIYTTGGLDTRGWLYDGNEDLLVFNDDSLLVGRVYSFNLRRSLSSGVYYLSVRSYDEAIGDYTLYAETVTDPGNTTGTAAALNLDSPAPGTIDTASDADYFRLDLAESKSLVIYTKGLALHDGSSLLPIDPLDGTVLDNSGTEISVNIHPQTIDGFGWGFRIEDDFEAGTYYVKVTAPASDTTYPVPYTIHAYEDAEYTTFIDDCTTATASLNNPEIDDPLYGCQWHLNNREGQDINVEAVWTEGIDGEGVNIAVVDDTVDYSHEDLSGNIDSSLNHDYEGLGGAYRPFDHHGTAVAGIIAAQDNGVGVRGVAPKATVYGYNYLSGDWQQFEDINRANAMARNRVVTAVSNNSWGPGDGPWLGKATRLWELAVDSGIREGYDGKGTFYVFAGGNGGRGHDLNPDGTLVGGHFNNVRSRGDDSNLDELANYYAVTAVCAVNDQDTRSVYSEKGANLWVCAPSSGDWDQGQRRIVTTENSDRYRDDFNGTSAAAPIVSGVAALLRHANPDLTWRDLKLILAASARKNDATNSGWEDGPRKYGAGSSNDLYHFNHEYGFGVVDARAAVDLAREWTNAPLLESASAASQSATTIPPPGSDGPRTVTTTLTLNTGIKFTEFVEINTDFDHTSFRDMDIELVSPSGAVSKLAVPFNTRYYEDTYYSPYFYNPYFVRLDGEFRFGSARHLGEDPNGVWTLRLTDHYPELGGTLRSWNIKVYGHASDEPAASSDATLSGLAVSLGELVGFGSDVTEYQVGVANDVSQIDIIPTANHPGATIRWGVHEITSGVGRAFSILEGLNVFEFTVTAQDNSTTKTYTVNVARGSGAAFGWKVTDDFNDLGLDSNVYPTGIWSNGNTMWVACKTENNNIPANLCSYSMATKERGSNFHTLGTHGNNNPQGITSDGTTMWVADVSDKRIYAYRMSNYSRNTGREINLAVAGILQPRGITVEPVLGGFWVANNADPDLLYAYNRYTLKRIPRADFGTLAAARNASPSGIWTDGTTMWVADRHDSKLYAYDRHTKARVPSKDFNSLIAAGNTDPWGIWSDGTTMWVADISKKKIFSYNMPDDTDAALSGLTVSPVDIEGFQSGVTAYHVGVANDVTGVTITPTTTEPVATIDINGGIVTSGSSHSVSLAEGRNDITITVTAGDGTTTEVYTVTVGRAVTTEFGWNSAKDFNTLHATGSDYPTGIWSDGTTMWVADLIDEKIYAYSVPTKARDAVRDFETLNSAGNDHPVGIWSDGTTMWVSDNSDDKIYAYDLVTKARAASNDFDTLIVAGNENPAGLWSDGTTMWVLDATDEKIYAYDIATKIRDEGKEFNALSGTSRFGTFKDIWSDGNTMWVAKEQGAHDVSDDRIYAYDILTKGRTPSKDFNGLTDTGINKLWGIWSDGATMWAANYERRASNNAGARIRYYSSKIYAFNMPVVVQPTPPPDATLSGLTVNPVDIGGFSSDLTEYHVGVANSVTQASITATASDADATIDVNGSVVSSGAPHTVSLTEGRNEVTVTVTANDKETVETYTVVIGRGVATAFGWKADDDFNNLAAGNNYPSGLWSDGMTMWVANYNNAPISKIFAYDLSTKARDESKDFNTLTVRGSGTVSGNSYPTGIWSDGTTMWVADGEDAKIYAYNLSTKARDESKDFDTLSAAGNSNPRGIWSDGTTMWVVDHSNDDDKVFAYNLATKARDSSRDIDTLRSDGNRRAFGIWSDGTTMWVGDSLFLKLYAYDLATKSRDPSKDFDALHPTLDYITLGIWSDGATMWVTDLSDRKIYSYNMPAAPAPDLVVDTPSVSDSAPAAGASFTLSATVRNQGSGSSGSTTLRYYRSTDSTITSGDTEVGTDSVSRLDASESGDESVSLTAPSTPGTYYYGACVDSVSGESDTDNNCSTAVAVSVGGTPDGAPAAPAWVKSQKVDVPLAPDYVRVWWAASLGATWYETGKLGNVDAPATEVIDDRTCGFIFYVFCGGGPYKVKACSDAGCSEWTHTMAPDLVVDPPSVDDSTPAAGASFTLSATVRNQGNGSSDSTTLRYYQSADSTISASDAQVAMDSVSSLAGSAASAESIELTAPSVPGTYYYGACVDAVSDESDTTNNCSTAVTVAVGATPAPDLVVDTPTVDDSSPDAGAPITLSATVRNQGSGPSDSTTLRYYRSADSRISSSDTAVGTDSVSGLSASGTSAEDISLTAPSTPGTYYYGACVDVVSDESDTTNNCSTAVAVAVGEAPAPDLVVDNATVSDSAPAAGASFRLSATVRNQGSGSSDSTTLRYYRSTDSSISSLDTAVGTDSVSRLDASESGDESVSLTAPSTPGTYYYGACVDAVSDEIDTQNNCSTAVAVAVGAALGNPANQRYSWEGSTTVLSWDAVAGADYYKIYYDDFFSSGCRLSSSGRASFCDELAANVAGTSYTHTSPDDDDNYYWVTACNSGGCSEIDSENPASLEGSAPAPDLVVDNVTVSDSAPAAGGSFTLSAAVRNQGSGSSDSTTLRYYRSTDATIAISDTEVGTDYVSRLDASESGDESVSLTAPSTPGTYYYGACVDAVSDESDTTNNCSTGVAVAVGEAPAPDLVVDTPMVSDSAPAAGASFTLSATVRNQGSGSSDSTTLRYYRSTDSSISSLDTAVGTDYVSRLDASESGDESVRLSAPATPGTYYYGACVDAVSDEIDTQNNCSTAVAVAVGEAPAPDLVVGNATVSDSAPAAGGSFTLSAVVRNQGSGPSASTTLRYYRSTDSSISSLDTAVGTDSVSGLSAAETSAETIRLTAPDTPGTYHYGACVDAVSQETDPGNNCSTAVTVAVGAAPAPDLVVDPPSVSDSTPDAGASFTLSATVRNQGNGSSGFTTLHYYRSTDSTITAADTQVGTDDFVLYLNALASSDKWTDLIAPETPGTYYYGACVDAVRDESDTTNNCSTAVTVTVGAAPAPDLVVDPPSVDDSTPAAGASFTLSATVRNQGNGSSDSTTLRYYQSADSTISASDAQVAMDSVSSLAGSAASAESIELTAPSVPGTYYYGACVDAVSDESDTTNNCSTAVTVAVGATPAPDLVVDTPTVSDSNPAAGASFILSATVRNQGSAAADATTLRYYRSADSSISSSDTAVGTDSVSGLSASGTSFEDISLTAPSTPGTYYYGACVDAVSDEIDTQNNCSTAVAVAVGEAPAPDLVVDNATVSDNAPAAGASFTLSAVVRNQGSGSSASTTLRYYRSTDSTITSGDTEVGTDSVSSLDASESSPQTISLSAPSTLGTYYYGACVDAVDGEANTSNDCSDGVKVTVVAVAPGAPTELSATASGPTEIVLSWNAPAYNGGEAITGYRIEMSPDKSGWSDLVADTNSTSTNYTHTGLVLGDTRHYRVSAINPAGTGPVSNIASATTAATASGNASAARSFSSASVEPGGQVTVTITAANYGTFGRVTETLPQGFAYVSSSLSDSQVTEVDARTVRFNLLGNASFTYTVTASSVEDSYSFSGTLTDSDRNEHVVGGAATVTVSSGDPLVARYDVNGDGAIDIDELFTAIDDYFAGLIGIDEIFTLIDLYFSGPA